MWLKIEHPLSPHPKRLHEPAVPEVPQQPHGKTRQEEGTGAKQDSIDTEVGQEKEHKEEAQEVTMGDGLVLTGRAQGHLMYAAIAVTLLLCLGASQSQEAVIAVIGGVVGGLLILILTEGGKEHGS